MAVAPSTPKSQEETRNANQSMDRARDSASQAVDKGKDAARAVGDAASHAASAVGSVASEAACAVGKTADHLASSAGSGIKSLGDTIQKNAPKEGIFGSASQAVASGLQEGGKYIQEEGLSGMFDDMTNLVRRNPIPAVLVGIGLGFLIGRTLRS